MKTFLVKPGEVERQWWVIDAEGQVLGRLATRIAKLLMGKHKPLYTPHVDTGDFVVVINAEKVVLTGKKWEQKKYYRHSGYPGGLKIRTARQLRETFPERLIQLAVRRMLPKNKLGRRMLKRLKVYAGPTHPHAAQKPVPLNLEDTVWLK